MNRFRLLTLCAQKESKACVEEGNQKAQKTEKKKIQKNINKTHKKQTSLEEPCTSSGG